MEINQYSNEKAREIKAQIVLDLATRLKVQTVPVRLEREDMVLKEVKRPPWLLTDYKELKDIPVIGGSTLWLVVSIDVAKLKEVVKQNPDFSFLTPDF